MTTWASVAQAKENTAARTASRTLEEDVAVMVVFLSGPSKMPPNIHSSRFVIYEKMIVAIIFMKTLPVWRNPTRGSVRRRFSVQTPLH
jgi:hypothetical protein